MNRYYGYIYETTNLLNNRKYIGQKKGEFDGRYYGSGLILKKAIQKHGLGSFEVKVLASAENKAKLDELERSYIAEYRRIFGSKLYNLTDGGTGGDTWSTNPRQEEIRPKLRLIWKDKRHSKESLDKMHNVIWMNNSVTGECERISPIDKQAKLDNGWVEGRTNFNPTTTAGKKWMHNRLTKEEHFVDAEQTKQYTREGWEIGRLPGVIVGKNHLDGCTCGTCIHEHPEGCNCYGCQPHTGEKNGRFGVKRAWINKDGQNKQVLLEDRDSYLENGWIRGMKGKA